VPATGVSLGGRPAQIDGPGPALDVVGEAAGVAEHPLSMRMTPRTLSGLTVFARRLEDRRRPAPPDGSID